MKFGETLRQRSIPEWAHQNLDYDEIKTIIKKHTTPGQGTAISVPGTGDASGENLERSLYHLFATEHQRIDDFYRSKYGEIERRLTHLQKQLERLHDRKQASSSIPARRRERYAKLEGEVIKVGQEVQALSRYRKTQCVGITKLLKKYKRWTKSDHLEQRFRKEILNHPDSFFQDDVDSLLQVYMRLLQQVRSSFDATPASSGASQTVEGNTSAGTSSSVQISPAGRLHLPTQSASNVDFDAALAACPPGKHASNAVYWIHPDNVIEVQVLLLQHSRLYMQKTNEFESNQPNKRSQKRSEEITADPIGFLIVDNEDRYAQVQSAALVDQHEDSQRPIRPAASARWNGSEDAVVVVEPPADRRSDEPRAAKLKRRRLNGFLDVGKPFPLRTSSDPSSDLVVDTKLIGPDLKTITKARKWLSKHQDTEPLFGLCTQRTRFVGLANSDSRGLWATLDLDISMKKSLQDDVTSSDWLDRGRMDSICFPFAVLSVRLEGGYQSALVPVLDNSHLLERVRGFSIEAHALWACRQPLLMSKPSWISILDTDIRKVPQAPIETRRRFGSISGSASSTPHRSSVSTAGQKSTSTVEPQDTSATEAELITTSTAPIAKKKRKRARFHPDAGIPKRLQDDDVRYYSEYDHPEDMSDPGDDAYLLYVDPDAEMKFPGQEMCEKAYGKMKQWFRGASYSEYDPLVSPTSVRGAGGSDPNSSDEEAGLSKGTTAYGAIDSRPKTSGEAAHGIFSRLFGKSDYQEAPIGVYPSFASELEVRRQRESSKLYAYVLSIFAAVVIAAIVVALAAAGRKKWRGTVDVGILGGVVASAVLAGAAIGMMHSRQDRLGWMHRLAVYAGCGAVACTDAALVVWMIGP